MHPTVFAFRMGLDMRFAFLLAFTAILSASVRTRLYERLISRVVGRKFRGGVDHRKHIENGMTQDVRDYAASQGLKEDEALQKGMKEKAA
jgi:hypothetical protein